MTRPAAGLRCLIGIGLPVTTLLAVGTVHANPRSVSTTACIEGRVRFAGPPARRPLPVSLYPSRQITEPGVPRPAVLNVVVYLQNAPAADRRPMQVDMRQQDEEFVPAVLPVTVGSTVEFPNEDDYFHNVFSLSHAASFDLGRYPRGESRRVVMEHPGVVKVFCHLHAHMHAVIFVLAHPYFTTPSADGAFSICNVPPGRYRVAAWHERVGETRTLVDVRPGQVAHAEIALPYTAE